MSIDGTNGVSVDGQVQFEATSVSPDTVGSAEIIDGEVKNVDIFDGAVGTSKLANGAVTDVKITGPISAGKLDLSGVVAKAGDTMTGSLEIAAGSVVNFRETSNVTIFDSKDPGDANVQFAALRSGGLFWGDGTASVDTQLFRSAPNTLRLGTGDTLQVSQDPVVDNDLARKKYVDDTVAGIDLSAYVQKAGSTMTGNLVMSGGADIELGSGSVVLGTNQGIQALNGAPGNALLNSGSGGSTYFITNFDGTLKWGPGGAVDTELRRVGVGTIAMGAGDKIQQNEAPTVGDDLTNKTYVDGQISGIASTYVDVVGDTMTGALEIDASLLGGTTPALDFTYNATGFRAFSIDSLGVHYWADPATGTIDTQLSRAAAGVLALAAGDQLRVLQDPIVDDDVARKKYVDDQITNETAFGDHYEYNRNVASATTTLTTPIERARVDLTGMAAGDYLVVGQAHFSTSNANARIKLQIVQDPDGAPVELDDQITVGPAVSVTGTMYLVAQVTLPAGSESFAVRFWHDSGSGSSTLEESTIYAHRVA